MRRNRPLRPLWELCTPERYEEVALAWMTRGCDSESRDSVWLEGEKGEEVLYGTNPRIDDLLPGSCGPKSDRPLHDHFNVRLPSGLQVPGGYATRSRVPPSNSHDSRVSFWSSKMSLPVGSMWYAKPSGVAQSQR